MLSRLGSAGHYRFYRFHLLANGGPELFTECILESTVWNDFEGDTEVHSRWEQVACALESRLGESFVCTPYGGDVAVLSDECTHPRCVEFVINRLSALCVDFFDLIHAFHADNGTVGEFIHIVHVPSGSERESTILFCGREVVIADQDADTLFERCLKKKSKVKSKDLFQAVVTDDIERLRDLLSTGTNVQVRDRLKNTPLHYVRSIQAAKMLIEAGAELSSEGERGDLPYWTVRLSDVEEEVFEYIYYGANPMHSAARLNDLDMLKSLIGKIEINKYDKGGWSTPLEEAVRGDSVEALEVLIFAGGNVFGELKRGATLADRALGWGRDRCLEFLCSKNVTISADTIIHVAGQKDGVKRMKLLRRYGYNLNVRNVSPGESPMHGAATADIVAFLSECGIDVNIATKRGTTPLHYAVWRKNLEVVLELVKLGAKVELCGKHPVEKIRLTPLEMGKELGADGESMVQVMRMGLGK